MKFLQLILWGIEYLGLRLADGLYRLVPAYHAYGFGWKLAALIYPFFRRRRHIAVENILRARITRDRAEAERIARHSFCHIAGHICEALKASSVITRENWRKHVVLEGNPADGWNLLMEQTDTPVLLISGHHGAWEVATILIPFTRPMIALARRQKNPLVDRFLRKNHFRGSVTLVSRNEGFTPEVIRQWKRERAALTILVDQHAAGRNCFKVDFMGRPASTQSSAARIFLKTRIPVMVGSFLRDGPFQYRMLAAPPFDFKPTGNRDADIQSFLTEMNKRLEFLIRRYPEQYLWMHRRWR